MNRFVYKSTVATTGESFETIICHFMGKDEAKSANGFIDTKVVGLVFCHSNSDYSEDSFTHRIRG